MSSSRRSFLTRSAATGVAVSFGMLPSFRSSAEEMPSQILGQGDFRYRLVPNWPQLAGINVKNGHGLVFDREGFLYLLTDHAENNLIVIEPKTGAVVHQRNLGLSGGHGLTIVEEGTRQVLFMTCLKTHRVIKTTLQGEVLLEIGWPEESGKYKSADAYKPSWTLHLPGGDFFVLDGYGQDYVMRYNAEGKLVHTFGGAEGGIPHWGPHGGIVDLTTPQEPTLLLAMSDRQCLSRWTPAGTKLADIPLPSTDPRMLEPMGDHWLMPTIGDQWPKSYTRPGYLSILDRSFRVVANIGASAPVYDEQGTLQPIVADGVFRHPHDTAIGPDGAIYVAQFNSADRPLVKLERI